MSKKLQREFILLLFPVISIVLTATLYRFVPDFIPASYTLVGEVIRYNAKSIAIFIMPVLSLFFYLYFLIVPYIDKERVSYTRFEKAYYMMRLISNSVLLIVNVLYILSLFYPGRVELIIALKVLVAVGLIFFGDRLPKLKRNHFIGVVNPWTLRNKIVWHKTQRFTGKLLFTFGIILFMLSFINVIWVNAIYLAMFIAILLIPHIYSANTFYVKEKDNS